MQQPEESLFSVCLLTQYSALMAPLRVLLLTTPGGLTGIAGLQGKDFPVC